MCKTVLRPVFARLCNAQGAVDAFKSYEQNFLYFFAVWVMHNAFMHSQQGLCKNK